MNTLVPSELFFFISSVGFVMLWILIAILLIYLIRIMHVFSRIIGRIEKDTKQVGEITKDMLSDIQDNTVYKFIFGKKKKGRKNTKIQ